MYNTEGEFSFFPSILCSFIHFLSHLAYDIVKYKWRTFVWSSARRFQRLEIKEASKKIEMLGWGTGVYAQRNIFLYLNCITIESEMEKNKTQHRTSLYTSTQHSSHNSQRKYHEKTEKKKWRVKNRGSKGREKCVERSFQEFLLLCWCSIEFGPFFALDHSTHVLDDRGFL